MLPDSLESNRADSSNRLDTENSLREDFDEENQELLQNGPIVHKPLPLRSLLALNCGLGGLQVVWSTIFSNGTLYLKSLGVPVVLTAFIWATPALCGCLVQPLVGASSDKCTHSWGRRKPYILAGALGTTLSIFTLAWASFIGYWIATVFCSPQSLEGVANLIAQVCAVLSVCMLSIAVQPLQCGLRALTLDLCPPAQQVQAQSWAARFTGVGQILGCAAGLVVSPGPESSGEAFTFRILSLTAILSVNLSIAITFWFVREQPQNKGRRQVPNAFSFPALVHSLVEAFVDCPSLLRKVFAIQVLAWSGWFTYLYYNTSFVNDIYMKTTENPSSKLSGYVASLVGLAFSCVIFGTTLFLPWAVHRFQNWKRLSKGLESRNEVSTSTLLALWSCSLGLSAFLMFSTFLPLSFHATVVLMALNGISLAVTNWVPFALVGRYATHSNEGGTHDGIDPASKANANAVGALNGLHNMAISAPQVLAAIVSAIILSLPSAPDSQNGASWVLRAGGIAYLSAAVSALVVMLRYSKPQTQTESIN